MFEIADGILIAAFVLFVLYGILLKATEDWR